jgi:TonB family protein
MNGYGTVSMSSGKKGPVLAVVILLHLLGLKIGADYYPDGSVRAGEEGRCLVQITVSVAGRVIQASILSSSGFQRLDDACLPIVWTLKRR